ncbi:uncharacterized protein LOC135981876 isoform X3 [Chrysemys picta bellii]|uniref:uncharacterized protein LOC135981876 isoform X3 n=1 Tax=Chrysemys picta bellii TaxID=8478 RepID=UPI0032B1926B
MRLSLLVGLAAALTLVAVARADPGDLTEVEDAVGEREPTTPVRGRRQVEKQQQPRFRPGSLSLLRPAKVEPTTPVRGRRQVEKQQRPRFRPGSLSLLRPAKVEGPAPQGRGRRAVEGTQLRTLKPKQPRLPCSGCYSPLGFPKDNHQQKRVKREGQKPQPARRTRETTGNHGSESILGMDGRSGDPEPQDQERRRKAHGGEAQSQAESERLTLRCWL